MLKLKRYHSFFERIIVLLIVVAFLILIGSWATRMAAADNSLPLSSKFLDTQHLDALERDAQYAEMSFDWKDWKVGQRLSDQPFAVVTYWNELDTQKKAIIRIWTGFVTRDNQDLLTFWDELWIGADGKVTMHATDNDGMVKNYFRAKDQTVFQVKGLLGIMPWAANIPTDPESLASGLPLVPTDGSFNLYQIHYLDEPSLSANQHAIKLHEHIPNVDNRVFLPKDAIHHWANAYIKDLMERGVVKGFADGDIRPQNTLTRAEFAVLLSGALQTLPTEWTAPSVSAGHVNGSYTDLAGHWSEQRILGLLQDGILEIAADAKEKFYPDRAITRIEMVEWLAIILQNQDEAASTTKLQYTDLTHLSLKQKQALEAAAKAKIVTQLPHTAFRPEDSLTRAESFVVISNLLKRLEVNEERNDMQ